MTSDIASSSAGTAKCTRVGDGESWVLTHQDTTKSDSVRRPVYNNSECIDENDCTHTCDIVCVCVCVRVRVRVRACVRSACVRERACVRACVRGRASIFVSKLMF